MMGKDQDKHLDEYLAGSDGLSSLYAQGGNDQPLPAVDKKILQAARNAIPKKATGTGPFSGNWKIPVALAAVLVLAVGVSITLERQLGSKPYRIEHYSPEVSSPTPPAAKPKPAKKKEAERLRKPGEALSKQPAAPAAEPMLETAPAPAKDKENKPVAPGPAAADVMEAPGNLETEQATPMENASEGLMKQQGGETKLTEPAKPQTAERWLRSIQELVQQNKTAEAKQQLADFRRVYPDYPLPDELRNLDR